MSQNFHTIRTLLLLMHNQRLSGHRLAQPTYRWQDATFYFLTLRSCVCSMFSFPESLFIRISCVGCRKSRNPFQREKGLFIHQQKFEMMKKTQAIVTTLLFAAVIALILYVGAQEELYEAEKAKMEQILEDAQENAINAQMEKFHVDTALANLQHALSLQKLQIENQKLKFQRDSVVVALACKDSLLQQARAHTVAVERLATANTAKVIEFAERLVDIAERYPDANRPRNITFSIRGTVADTTITHKLK